MENLFDIAIDIAISLNLFDIAIFLLVFSFSLFFVNNSYSAKMGNFFQLISCRHYFWIVFFYDDMKVLMVDVIFIHIPLNYDFYFCK